MGARAGEYDNDLKEADEVFQDINDFVLCEKPLVPIGRTCYISTVLTALNSCRRYVLSYLMRDPFPY